MPCTRILAFRTQWGLHTVEMYPDVILYYSFKKNIDSIEGTLLPPNDQKSTFGEIL